MKIIILIAALIIILGGADVVSAQSTSVYKPLVQIPGLDANSQSTSQYVEALYILSITVAAFLAVVKIIFGGVKWMLSDVVTDKSAAKKDIWGAIIGLLIVLSAVLILNTINPQLKELNFLQNAPGVATTLGGGEEEPPLVDAAIGDTLLLGDAEQNEITHFKDTCPGVPTRIVTSNGVALECIAEEDAVEGKDLACTGDSCTCDYSDTGNRGVCMQACQTQEREGYTFQSATDLANERLRCEYSAVNDPAECADVYFLSCNSSWVGGPACEITQEVCRQEVSGFQTFFYGFAN